MVTLERALAEHPLILLRILGEWWELDLTGHDAQASAKAVAAALRQVDMAQELLYMPEEEAAALRDLAAAGGKLPVATFSRRHGAVRQMGPGRMEREEPWLNPESAAEGLWYRGFLYRGFDETPEGLSEFYYLPQELWDKLAAVMVPAETPTAAPATTALLPVTAPETYNPAPDNAVDDLTTVLAVAQRYPLNEENIDKLQPYLLDATPRRRMLLVALAWEMGLLRRTEQGIRPTRAAVEWLQQGREQQLQALAEAWSASAWNELRHTADLVWEGHSWHNDPLLARTALLEHLPRRPEWYPLDALVGHIKTHDPDFQRPDGDYAAWYIRDAATNTYLQGFENWDRVEGRLLRFLIEGPLHWLGLVEYAPHAFRPTARLLNWLERRPAPPVAEGRTPIIVQADGAILAPRHASRYDRFQLSRVAEAQPVELHKPYVYRLTPRSLLMAQEQGIEPARVLEFLQRASDRPVPAGLRRAVERWAAHGVEGRLRAAVILQVQDGRILDTLRQNPKTSPYLGETLGELAIVVRAGEWQHLQQAAAQLGLLLDMDVAGSAAL